MISTNGIDKPDLHIIIFGNPVNGFVFYGPYQTHHEAVEVLEKEYQTGNEYWTAKLESPDLLEG